MLLLRSGIELVLTSQMTDRWPEVRKLIDHAMRRDDDAIGWLPFYALDQYHLAGHILTCWREGDLVGFCLWRPSPERFLKVIQVWVRPDARMIEHGRAIVDRLESLAVFHRCSQLSLWCADDLAANVFWRVVGFQWLSWRFGSNGRKHNQWRLPVRSTLYGTFQGRTDFQTGLPRLGMSLACEA